jgi:hypothetical protein
VDDLAGAYVLLGSIAINVGKMEDAQGFFDQAGRLMEGAFGDDPDDPQVRETLCSIERGLAWVHQFQKRHAESASAWRRAFELSSESLRSSCRVGLALALSYCGDVRQAIREADAARKSGAVHQGDDLYNLACAYACCAAATPAASDDYGRIAVELLSRAKQAGRFSTEHAVDWLMEDPDLESLRERDDFQELVTGLHPKPAPDSARTDSSETRATERS